MKSKWILIVKLKYYNQSEDSWNEGGFNLQYYLINTNSISQVALCESAISIKFKDGRPNIGGYFNANSAEVQKKVQVTENFSWIKDLAEELKAWEIYIDGDL